MPSSKKILVIDDEIQICDFLSGGLKRAGYEPITALLGQDGLEKALDQKPALILLDIMLPDIDGWQVLSRLRKFESTKNIPVVILTGKGDTDTIFKCQQQKVADYFMKPINMPELLAFIHRYISSHQS